jgi:hypothetical protein
MTGDLRRRRKCERLGVLVLALEDATRGCLSYNGRACAMAPSLQRTASGLTAEPASGFLVRRRGYPRESC